MNSSEVRMVRCTDDLIQLVNECRTRGVNWSLLSRQSTGTSNGIFVNLDGYADVLSVTPDGSRACVQSGCTWRQLETVLSDHNLTLGPIPYWMADHSIAQSLLFEAYERPSPRYGDFWTGLLALRYATADGEVFCAAAPRRSMGPDLERAIRMSGSAIGLVTEIEVRVWPRPNATVTGALRVSNMSGGLKAMTTLKEHGVLPAWWMLRKCDDLYRVSFEIVDGMECERVRQYICQLGFDLEWGGHVEENLKARLFEDSAVDNRSTSLCWQPVRALMSCRHDDVVVWDVDHGNVLVSMPSDQGLNDAENSDWSQLARSFYNHLGQRGVNS